MTEGSKLKHSNALERNSCSMESKAFSKSINSKTPGNCSDSV